jgi:hypothetical protein
MPIETSIALWLGYVAEPQQAIDFRLHNELDVYSAEDAEVITVYLVNHVLLPFLTQGGPAIIAISSNRGTIHHYLEEYANERRAALAAGED